MQRSLASPAVGMPSQPAIAVGGRLWLAAALFLLLILAYYQTVASMVATWLRSETYTHGLIILPISLWLIWQKRDGLAAHLGATAPAVLALSGLPGVAWLAARLVDVQVVEQLAFVAMLVVCLWAVLGHSLARFLAFPLLFLFFAVPMGEALVEPMMDFTASSTVWLVRLTGIPVYREDLFIYLPSGNWSIVEACSGVRYIIASVTLGVLFAYLTYRSAWRRALFIAMSALVPIVANSLRAYLIVMLGHMSDMKIATGVDHLIYGWIFFGLVMFVLFWIGARFREDTQSQPGRGWARPGNAGAASSPPRRAIYTALSAFVLAAVWPLMVAVAQGPGFAAAAVRPVIPAPAGEWSYGSEPFWDWVPQSRVSGELAGFYQLRDQRVALYIQFPETAETAADVVGSAGLFAEKAADWRLVGRRAKTIALGQGQLAVEVAVMARARGRGREKLYVWSYYQIGDSFFSNDYRAKLEEIRLKITGRQGAGSYRILLVTPFDELAGDPDEILRRFVLDHRHLVMAADTSGTVAGGER